MGDFFVFATIPNTHCQRFFSQHTPMLALEVLVRKLNYVNAPLGSNLPVSLTKVLSRLLKLTNFHGNKAHHQ